MSDNNACWWPLTNPAGASPIECPTVQQVNLVTGVVSGRSLVSPCPMKITEVEAFLMSFPLPEPMVMPFWGGERTIIKRDAMLIRVKTDVGLVGYAPGPAHERAANDIRDTIRPFLIGKEP